MADRRYALIGHQHEMGGDTGIYPVYLQSTAPVAGVGGVPDPIYEGSAWYDSDDSYTLYVYASGAWEPVGSGGGSSVGAGTTVDSVLTWSGSAWEEETNALINGTTTAYFGGVIWGNKGFTTQGAHANSHLSGGYTYADYTSGVARFGGYNATTPYGWVTTKLEGAPLTAESHLGDLTLTGESDVIITGTNAGVTVTAGSGDVQLSATGGDVVVKSSNLLFDQEHTGITMGNYFVSNEDTPGDFEATAKFQLKHRTNAFATGQEPPGDDTYVGVLTVAPGVSDSWGPNYQLVFSNTSDVPVVAVRAGDWATAGGGTWDDWYTLVNHEDNGLHTLNKFNFNTSDTLEASHVGAVTGKDNTTSYTLTGPTSGDLDFPVGRVCKIMNLGTSTDYTIADTATCTMYILDGSGVTDIAGTAAVAPGGVVTLYRYSATAIYLYGTNLT